MRMENPRRFIYGYRALRKQGKGIRPSLKFAWHHMMLNRNFRKEADHIKAIAESGYRRVLNENKRE